MTTRKGDGRDRPDNSQDPLEPEQIPNQPDPKSDVGGASAVPPDDTDPDAEENYPVGYGKPPKAYQFKPGESGNRRGRRKGSKNAKTLLKEGLHAKIDVKDRGRRRKLSKFEVMISAQINRALTGDTRAFKEVMALAERYGLADEVETAMKRVGRDDAEIIEAFLRRSQDVPAGPSGVEGDDR